MAAKRKMYDNLMGDLDQVPVEGLQKALGEIISGMSCFGPEPDWVEWYPYLLGRLIPRSHERFVSYLLESLIGGFLTQYPDGMLCEPYEGFRADIMNTLGSSMMDRSCWMDGEIVVGAILHDGEWPNGLWGWFNASGDFSASMFFCLKYLEAEEIDGWMKSVLAIRCPHWRAQVIAWFVGAQKMLNGEMRQPADLQAIRRASGVPKVDWEDSHCLDGNYSDEWTKHTNKQVPDYLLPAANRTQALATVRSVMTQDLLNDWLVSMRRFEYLEAELLYLPKQFLELYGAR